MMFENLTAKDTIVYARKVYDNPACMTEDEFLEDYKRFKYIKRLCRRYLTEVAKPKKKKTAKQKVTKASDDIQQFSERLMMNHLILLTNMFGVEATVRILFVKCDGDEKLWRVLKPFLWKQKYLPEIVRGVNGANIYTDRIAMDEPLLRKLKELYPIRDADEAL